MTVTGTTTGHTLTVVVPTIPGREQLLGRCLASIQSQAPPEVDILVVDGTGQLGSKVQLAVASARTEYLTVVDDDDYLAPTYMDRVLPLCATGVDYIGLQVHQYIDGEDDGISETRGDLAVFGRRAHGPTPKGVTKLDIWRRHPMKNFYTADRAWCAAVAPEIRTHAFVDEPVYIYDWWKSTSAFVGEGQGRDVGTFEVDLSRIFRLTL